MGSTTGGSLVLSLAEEPSLAGELSLAGDFSLARERSLAGESSLGGVVEADGISGAASGHSGEAALLLHKPIDRCQQIKSTHARLMAGSRPYTYAGGCFGE